MNLMQNIIPMKLSHCCGGRFFAPSTLRWHYGSYFESKCRKGSFASEKCADKALKEAGMDPKIIATCMSLSGGLEKDQSNQLLQPLVLFFDSDAIYPIRVPFIRVNKVRVKRPYSFETVFHAICAAFASGHAPRVCQRCMGRETTNLNLEIEYKTLPDCVYGESSTTRQGRQFDSFFSLCVLVALCVFQHFHFKWKVQRVLRETLQQDRPSIEEDENLAFLEMTESKRKLENGRCEFTSVASNPEDHEGDKLSPVVV